MVELGKYFVPVLAAYGISLFGIAVIILSSWQQARKTKIALNAAEARREARKVQQNGV